MFKSFFKYLDDFLVFWMDDLVIYSQTEGEHLKHIQLVFEKFHKAGIKLKMSKSEFFKNGIECLGHLVSRKEVSPIKQKVKAISDLAPATNITEARHMIGLIGYYRKFFPIFSDMIWLLNELTKKHVPFKQTKQCQKGLAYINRLLLLAPY